MTIPKTLKGNIRKILTGDGRVSPKKEVGRELLGVKKKGKYN